jgi:hypothetical protein
MNNNRILAAVICAVGVAFAAMFANAPTGVAGSQENQDHWEVSSPSDATLPALRARITRLEQRVATLENQTEGSKPSPEPVRSSVAAPEPWQTPTVVELAPSQPQTIGQYQSATTITQTTETVCTGDVCRPQTTNATGPLRRIFRR